MKVTFTVLFLTFCFFASASATDEIETDTCNYSLDVFNTKGIKTVKINGSHAKINIYNWERDSVSFESTVKILSDKPIIVEELLGLIKVEAQKTKSAVSLNTILDKGFSSTVPYEITFNIFMPKEKTLDITNSHGEVIIPEVTNGVTLKAKYCDISIYNIKNSNKTANNIYIAFCKADINQIGSGNIRANSSKLNIEQCDTISLITEYSQINIIEADQVESNSNIDKINIQNCNDITMLAENSIVKLEQINSEALFEFINGQLDINNTSDKLSSLQVSNKNTITNLQLHPQLSYILNGEIKDGELIVSNKNQISLLHEAGKTSFSGSIGKHSNFAAKIVLFNENQDISIK